MNNGGPAFPFTRRDSRSDQIDDQFEGMTLRDHFAGIALGSIMEKWDGERGENGENPFPILAEVSYAMADAMLLERAK